MSTERKRGVPVDANGNRLRLVERDDKTYWLVIYGYSIRRGRTHPTHKIVGTFATLAEANAALAKAWVQS